MQQDTDRCVAGKLERLTIASAKPAWALCAMSAAPALAQKHAPPDVMERVHEAQKSLDALSPEQKKQLRDMGIALPDAALIPRATESELQAGPAEVGVFGN